MNNLLYQRINQFEPKTNNDYINAVREVIQEITLFSLSKTDFFTKAAFLGGTALRIFYGLDRASEDLDFSLIEKDDSFSIDKYLTAIKDELLSFGLSVDVTSKKDFGAIQSAFVKGDTTTNLISIGFPDDLRQQLGHIPFIRVKLEIDTNPPEGATYEYKYGLFPFPYRVLVFDQKSLFSGKIHAILCRDWIKGRDYYDYVFYISRNISPNLDLLINSLIQTGFLKEENNYSIEQLKKDLFNRFKTVNYDEAVLDCTRFIKNQDALSLWNSDFFISITEQLK